MSDKDALYADLIATQIDDPSSRPRRQNDEGTIWERLGDIIGEYDTRRLLQAIEKGTHLNHLMLLDNYSAGQLLKPPHATATTQFLDPAELRKWGYRDIEEIPFPNQHPGDRVFEEMGFNGSWAHKGGQYHWVRHSHYTESEVDGHFVKASQAEFMQIVNPGDGMLAAINNTTPLAAVRQDELPEENLPELSHWSDIAYLQWKMIATDDTELKLVLRYNITNQFTIDVIDWINDSLDRRLDRWPGYTYDAASEEGKALLGTPNGAGVAWLLIQHKEQLGHKVVEKVTVFAMRGHVMLLFHIVDSPTTTTVDRSA